MKKRISVTEAGRLGGMSTKEKYGAAHFSKIGKMSVGARLKNQKIKNKEGLDKQALA